MKNMTDAIDNDNNNGIVKWNKGDEEYTFWTHADFIKPYIIHYLEERFPGKLVVRELNNIDLSIPKENLPIEVQATTVEWGNSPAYSRFEKDIEKQINQGIVYGICWFFFDSELLRAMKNAGRGMSINMVWFRNYMKEGKLKVFTVSYDEIFKELEYKDFDFLSEVSQTCPIAAEADDAILNKNKMKIYTNVVEEYEFTQDEIDKFFNDWRSYCDLNKINGIDKNDGFMKFLMKQKDERAKLYGYILNAIADLPRINDILGLENYQQYTKFTSSKLGIFSIEGSAQKSITKFIDRFNICQYFPGYIRNKEMWDKIKNHNLNARQFESIVKNGIRDYFWYENEDKKDITTESEQIDDKDVNLIMESKELVIKINIKTKQDNIEDAWNQK